jgi:hypothetical protein
LDAHGTPKPRRLRPLEKEHLPGIEGLTEGPHGGVVEWLGGVDTADQHARVAREGLD